MKIITLILMISNILLTVSLLNINLPIVACFCSFAAGVSFFQLISYLLE